MSLYRLCVPHASCERAGFDVDDSHIFPQGRLTSVTLVGGVADDGGASACIRCNVGLPL